MQANKFCKEYCYFTLSQWHMNILQSIPPAFYCNIRNIDKDVHLYHTSPLLSCISRCDSACWDTIPIGQGGGAFVRMLALLIELKYLNLYVQALKKNKGMVFKKLDLGTDCKRSLEWSCNVLELTSMLTGLNINPCTSKQIAITKINTFPYADCLPGQINE